MANGQITWIGRGEAPASALPPRAVRIDCEGGALMPGFVDAHCHPLALGAALTAADCRPAAARSIPEIQRQLALWAAASPNARHVRGFGYDELLLHERRHPNRHDLDVAVRDRPVVLTHGSGHALVLNTAGLRAAGITESADEPARGFIDREAETGAPSGLLLEMGSHVSRRLGRPTDGEVRRYASAASEALTLLGVTSVVDAGPSNDVSRFELWAELRKDQTFQPRLTVMQAPGSQIPEAEIFRLAAWVDAGPAKIVLIRGENGGLIPTPAELDEMVASALAAGPGVAVHAVEAESILMVCRVFEEARSRLDPRLLLTPAHRRIEHAAEATPEVCAAIKRCGATVVSQPGFIYGRGDRYLAAVDAGGWPVDHLYPLRTLLDQGIPVMFGSDAPYGPVSPLEAIYGAVTRTSASGRPVGRSQAIGTTEALVRSVNNSSPLRAGSPCDLVVLSEDPQSVQPERLRDITVRLTIIAGEIVWGQ
ncbi:MAG: amidohydrolase family protein [Candidatus Limnocylindrales bacterium]|nr:amidohydrolase family protein [Candidatus Limnocylindrales bacterium]